VPETGTEQAQSIAPRSILVGAFGTYRRRFGVIAGAALVVFGISATVDLLADVLADEAGDDPALVALVLTMMGLSVFGTEFFAGLMDRVAGEEERGHPRQPLRRILRTLPYGRLIAADVLLAVGTALFSLALVVPGIVFFTFFSLVGPVVVMEDRKVRDAFGRSRRLVRGHFWLVFILVTLPIVLEENVVHGIVEAFDGLGLLAVFVMNTLAGAVVGSIVAVVEVTLAHRLAIRKPERRWQESNPPDGVRPSHSF
jgi:hypothetical protein